jgi:predicted PurR-regulated permease PerM
MKLDRFFLLCLSFTLSTSLVHAGVVSAIKNKVEQAKVKVEQIKNNVQQKENVIHEKLLNLGSKVNAKTQQAQTAISNKIQQATQAIHTGVEKMGNKIASQGTVGAKIGGVINKINDKITNTITTANTKGLNTALKVENKIYNTIGKVQTKVHDAVQHAENKAATLTGTLLDKTSNFITRSSSLLYRSGNNLRNSDAMMALRNKNGFQAMNQERREKESEEFFSSDQGENAS